MIKNFIIYILLVLSALLLRIGVGGYATKLILQLIFAFPVIQFLYGGLMCFLVQVQIEELPTQMIQGERNGFGVQITNKCFFPLGVGRLHVRWKNNFTNETIREKIDFSMLPNSQLSLQCFPAGTHCGIVSFEITSVDVYDMVCMWKWKKPGRAKVNVLIRPPYEPIDMRRKFHFALWESENEDNAFARKGENTEEIVDIRGYQQGDKMQRVHWKLSAKMDEIMMKEFGNSMDVRTHIVVDLYVPHKKEKGYYMDELLQVLIAISVRIIQSGEQHTVYWFDGENLQSRSIKSQEQLWDCMQEIITGSLEEHPQSVSAYLEQGGQRNAKTCVYYVGPGWNQKSGEQLGKLSGGTELTAFLVDDYELWEVDEELLHLYENGGYTIHRIQVDRGGKGDRKNKWK